MIRTKLLEWEHVRQRKGNCAFPSSMRIRHGLPHRSQFFVLIILSYLFVITTNSNFSCGGGGGGGGGGCGKVFVCAEELDYIDAEVREVRYDTHDQPVRIRGKDEVNSIIKKNSKEESFSAIVKKAGKKGIGGGLPGAAAGVVQVLTLMWIRTVINYQYRYGTTFSQAIRTLLNQGGLRRFYRGVGFALIQNPLAKFGSTAANEGVQALVHNLDATRAWGPGRTTVLASIMVGLWRMFLMPIDTCKTVLQVDSEEGFRDLIRKVRAGKVNVLYQGAVANAISSIFSYYPWFYVYNVLSGNDWVKRVVSYPLLRNAGIGFVASVVSDTITNFIRVIKTTKQSIGTKHVVGYGEAISMILAADGIQGLFGRGLQARIFANGIQSVVFTVVWRGLADWWGI